MVENRFKDREFIISDAEAFIGFATASRAAKETAKLVLTEQKMK